MEGRRIVCNERQNEEKNRYRGRNGIERDRELARQGNNTYGTNENRIRGRTGEHEGNQRDRRIEANVVHKSDQTSIYAEILKNIKRSININKLGIEETRIRRTMAGSLVIQIAGERSKEKANILAEKMRNVVGSEARVARPSRKAEIKITNIDEDTIPEEVIEAIALEGRCDRAEVTAGAIRRNRMGLGSIWAKCPWNVAKDLNRLGRIRIGWMRASVELPLPLPSSGSPCAVLPLLGMWAPEGAV